jgi:uncharacterized membrane protein
MGKYSLIQWITFFFFYCFGGWIWETSYVSAKQGKFVNRGFLKGPMLPIYGSGAVMMLWVSQPFQGNYVLTFLSGMVGATLLELVTGWAMEKLFKVRYWDYSYRKFQFHGYICLASSLTWGLFTILMTELIQPPVAQIVTHMSELADTILVVIVGMLFLADTAISIKTAFDMAKAVETITRIHGELDNIQVQMALLKKETEEYLQENMVDVIGRMDDWKIKVMNVREESTEKAAARKQNILMKLDEMKNLDLRKKSLATNKEAVFRRMSFIHRSLLEGNPGAHVSKRFEKAFGELKEKFVK